ncbi:protein UPSTREAM OF FLC-like isoform X2 [Cynara cardunculus var. scolymus]|uniref:protein UPSTREAM OF FLC-like isoform X2 n=1 Tax=Cynara cardunculus var. scolymus TaxID=59895 RepID=UPI000D627B96|nr:protein UPSTREAM OF FLC-like isoform X2 [Cynara cardunculus var. scolymus]
MFPHKYISVGRKLTDFTRHHSLSPTLLPPFMAADSRKSVSEMLISKRPRKNRNHLNGNGNGSTDLIVGNVSDTSPIFIKPKTEPATVQVMEARKVPVLYYLTRNGHLEHPHLIDVSLSSPHDVLNTLNYHRGKGMANMYSWSFKRSYKSGYVWYDLSEDDLVEATNGHDYVLKGSELLETHESLIPTEANHNCSSTITPAAAMIRQRNQSWSSFDNPQEYMVVKCESSRELAARFAADAATQTEEQRRRRSFEGERKEQVSREEIPSPPPSNSSSEVSEGAKYVDQTVNVRDEDPTAEGSGRMKASQIVMQLISCGATSRLKGEKQQQAP